MRKTLLFVVAIALLGAGACFAQDAQTEESNPPASEEEFSLDKLIEELNEPETEKEKTGSDYLDQAMALKLSATGFPMQIMSGTKSGKKMPITAKREKTVSP